MVDAITNVERSGSDVIVRFADGYQMMCLATGGGVWVPIISNPDDSVDAPPIDPHPDDDPDNPVTPAPPPATGHVLIYPIALHDVSDSFQDHKNRGSVNPGTDYPGPVGMVVWAVKSGTVTVADGNPGGAGGRTVHINFDDGSGADYLHMSAVSVAVGQHVNQGDVIGRVGGSGYGSNTYYGAHIHISYRNNHSQNYSNNGNLDFDALIRAQG